MFLIFYIFLLFNRGKAKQKFQECKNALERSGINGPQKNKMTELDERVVGVMSKVAVVGEEEVGEPLVCFFLFI